MAERLNVKYGRFSTRSTTSLVVEFLIRMFGLPLLAGWTFMLAVGVAHHNWVPQLPTIGFGTSVLVSVLVGIAGRASWGRGYDGADN